MTEQAVTPTVDFHSAVELFHHRNEVSPESRPYQVVDTPSFTYREWTERSHAIARGLLERGVRHGDRVALIFRHPWWDEYAAAYMAVLRTGAVGVHLSAELAEEELTRRLNLTTPAGVIIGPEVSVPKEHPGWVATEADLAAQVPTGPPVHVPVGPNDFADILFTSGTTGPAKAFANPHGNLSFGEGPVHVGNFGAEAPILAPMPLGTPSSAGLVGMFALTSQARIVVCPTDDVTQMARLIEQYQIGTVMLVPWLATRFVMPVPLSKQFDLSSVTTIAIASAALPSLVARRLLAAMPNASIMTAYAQGEAVPAVLTGMYHPDHPLRVGKPAKRAELRVVVDERDAEPGEVGEVWLRSPAPRRRHLSDLNDHDPETWTRTGDLAHLDDAGFLVLFDRQVDAISTTHGLVSSLEVDEVLTQHPDVIQAVTYGVERGQHPARVQARVILRPESTATEAELLAHAAERLPSHAVPDRIGIEESLPRGLTNKVSKAHLASIPLRAGDSR